MPSPSGSSRDAERGPAEHDPGGLLRRYAALPEGGRRDGRGEAKADGAAVVAQMKAMPTDDDAFGPGRIREDGRALFPVYLFEVKAPAESKGKWEYAEARRQTPADQAWRPMSEGGCGWWKSSADKSMQVSIIGAGTMVMGSPSCSRWAAMPCG